MDYIIHARAETAEWGGWDGSDPNWWGQWNHILQLWVGRWGNTYNPGNGQATPNNTAEPPPVYLITDDNRVRQLGPQEYYQLVRSDLGDPLISVVLNELNGPACTRLAEEAATQRGYVRQI